MPEPSLPNRRWLPNFAQHRVAIGAGLALTLFTLWLRFRELGYTELFHDQARTLNMALQWVHGGPFPLTADLTSLGVHNLPLIIYLYALALSLQPNVWSVTYLLSALSLLGIAFYSWAMAKLLGWRVGWWAGALFVVAPWAVYYSRYIWQPSFVPIFAAGLFACTVLYLTCDPRPRWLVVGALFFSGTFQMHITSLTLAPVLIGLGLALRRQQLLAHRRWVMAALGLFVLSITPYLLFQLQTRLADWTAGETGLSGGLDVNFTAFELALDLLRSRNVFDIAGLAGEQWQAVAPFWQMSDLVLGVWFSLALLGGGILSHWLLGRSPEPRSTVWLISALWFVLPILPFIPHTRWVINHYFLHLIPAGFTLLALLSDTLYVWLSERLSLGGFKRLGTGAALIAFIPLGLILMPQIGVDLTGQAIMASGLAGKQRAVDTQRAIDQARQLMGEYPQCQLVVLNEVPLWEDSRFGLLREFVDAERVRIIEPTATALWPSPCAVYFVASQPSSAPAWLAPVAQPLHAATIQTPEETWRFYYVSPTAQQTAVERLQRATPQAIWENDIQLHQAVVHEDPSGQALQLNYVWVIGPRYRPPPPYATTSLRLGNYLLSLDGQLISQVDGVMSDSREWRVGDVIEQNWSLPIPNDTPFSATRVATAIYSLPDLHRIPLQGAGGDLWNVSEPNLSKP